MSVHPDMPQAMLCRRCLYTVLIVHIDRDLCSWAKISKRILEVVVGFSCSFTGFCCKSLWRVGQCFRNVLCTPTFFPKAHKQVNNPMLQCSSSIPAWTLSRILFVLWEEDTHRVTAVIQIGTGVVRQGEQRRRGQRLEAAESSF